MAMFFFVWFFFCFVCLFVSIPEISENFQNEFLFSENQTFFMKYISHFKLSITFFDSIFPVNFFAHHARLLKYKSDVSW